MDSDLLLTRLRALALETFPWLKDDEDQHVDQNRLGFTSLTIILDPEVQLNLLLTERNVIASMEYNHEEKPPDPMRLDNGTWTDFTGWIATVRDAYADFRTRYPCRAIADNCQSEIIPQDETPFWVNPATKEVFVDTDCAGVTGGDCDPVSEDCLWGFLRLDVVQFDQNDTGELVEAETDDLAINTIADDDSPF